MNKILYFLVISLFFFVIFFFSHIFYLFGSNYIFNIFGITGFEGVKSNIILLYGILFFLWNILYLFKYNINKKGKKMLIYVGILFILMSISTILSIDIKGSILGMGEKYHGLMFYFGLVNFYISIYFGLQKREFYKVLNMIFIFSFFIYAYGIIQFIGLDPLASLYESRIPITRISSFLGNPNYLAGYIVILLPLSKFIISKKRRILFLIMSFIVLILTKSYFGIFFGILYLLYLLYTTNKKIFIITSLSLFILSIYIFNNLSIEKKGSFLARPYIWKTTINAIIYKPKTILFGYGPETMFMVFDKFKVDELSIYENPEYTADRSHNLFFDFLFFFGIFNSSFLFYFFIKSLFITNDINIKISILLFFIYFSFNVPISIHFLLFVFILSGIYNKNFCFKK